MTPPRTNGTAVGTQVALEHRTSYRYDRAVRLSPHVVRLRPAPHTRTPVHDYRQVVTPGEHTVSWHQDQFGNHLARYVFAEPADHLDVQVTLLADLAPVNPFDFLLEPQVATWPATYEPAVAASLLPWLETDHPAPVFHEFLAEARALAAEGRGTIEVLGDVNGLVHAAVGYEQRQEPGVQTPQQTLERASGSCRDSSWLLVQALRQLGMASRFTSGYLVQLASEERAEDSADLHAWAEVYLPGAGWFGLDPTSGMVTAEGHLPLATATEPSLAAPVSGTTEPTTVDWEAGITLTRPAPDG